MIICNCFRLIPWPSRDRWLLILLLSAFSAVVLAPDIANADDPSFQKAIAFGHSEATQSVAVGDFNGDGRLDLVQGNAGQSYLYLNDDQGRFITAVSLSASGNTQSVAVGDLNGDGWLDIVQGNDDQSYLYLNDGQGGLTVAIKLGASSNAQSVAVGDLNGDGFLDIVQGNAGQSYLYLNDGQGRFAQSINLGTGEATQSVAVGDFNGDGWLDIAQGNVGPSYLYLNDGQGHLTDRINLGNGGPTQRLAVGDFNGDGALDIVQSNAGQNHLALNDGQGHFLDRINLDASEGANDVVQTTSLAVGDFNGDGRLDIVQGNAGQSYLYLHDPQDGFATRIKLGDREQTNSVTIGDLNGDGLLDIVQGNRADKFNNAGPSYVYLNDGQGAFTQIINLGPASATSSVAVGDFNRDGWLDIVQGNSDINKHAGYSYVYLNDGQGGFPQLFNLGSAADTRNVAVGDLNGDGWLDIVQGNATFYDTETVKYRPSVIFLNDGQGGFPDTNHLLGTTTDTASLALGDLNGDGALDIVQGSGTQSHLYLNDGHGNFPEVIPIEHRVRTQGVVVGDLNGDGTLDIVQGNYLQQSYIYLNDGQASLAPGIPIGHSERTLGIALGDLNGDGALDIVQGNDGASYIYLNDGRGNFPQSIPLGNKATTHSVTIGDLNGDGALDIVQGNYLQPQSNVYLNDGQGRFGQSIPLGIGQTTERMALGDFNNDGLLDIVQGNNYRDPYTGQFAPVQQSYIYRNGMRQISGLVNQAPHVLVTRPGPTGNANFLSSPVILSSPTIPITYTLFDRESEPVGRVEATYSLNGGGQWLPAVATSTTITAHLATGPTGVQHLFTWDTFASGIFGQADNVVLRLVAYSQPLTTTQPITGSYRYTNSIAGGVQWGAASATTFPFRLRGTQVRAVDEAQRPLPNALVYRLPAGQFSGATLLTDPAGQPFRTDAQGYLGGRGALQLGDKLVALLPVTATRPLTFTGQYSYFLTSAPPNTGGLTLTPLSHAGVITLTVPMAPTANTHPLLLFHLTVSLEWDASNDELFRVGLENGFKRASELLFKVSNGQAALGRVDVLPAKYFWNRADLILYASNSLRPSAAIGGVVKAPLDETVFANVDRSAAKKIMRAAYIPGQIQIGAAWDPFGEEAGDLSEQWWRALAHELSHHLLFLPDNYIGFKIDPQTNRRLLGRVDCRGSFMTTTFDPSYTRFLDQPFWLGDCLQTLAAFSTGRSDWETITHFYPMLKAPVEPVTAVRHHEPPDGPNLLPLDVTQVVFWTLPDQRPTLPARYFQLRNSAGTIVRLPTARVYLFQTQGTSTPTDDVLLALGSPTGGGDRIKVRGGQPGDRLCLFDFGASDGQTYTGCIPALSAADASIPVSALDPAQTGARWAPAIEVRALTTRTLVITVTQPFTPNLPLNVQVFPAHYPSAPGLAPVAALTLTQGIYGGQVVLPYPAADVLVRVWAEGGNNIEAISQFNLQLPWQPGDGVSDGLEQAVVSGPDRPLVGGPDRPVVGGPDRPLVGGPDYPVVGGAPQYNFAAPMVSADAQVVIYNQEGFFERNHIQSLQILPSPPALHDEPWLVPVGQAYLVEPAPGVTAQRTIAVTYLQKDVPEGYEHTLALYYLLRGGQQWQRLATERFVENLAVADLQSEAGIYAVMSTIALPPLQPGWNMITYPLPDSRPITDALQSIAGAYSVVYEPPADVETQLRAFADKPATIADQLMAVKTNVDHFVFGHVYWIKIDQPVTLYVAPPRRTPDGAVPGDQ